MYCLEREKEGLSGELAELRQLSRLEHETSLSREQELVEKVAELTSRVADLTSTNTGMTP